MLACIYARVSTADLSCELQLRELREYAVRRSWQVSGEYLDISSGAKGNRPELDRLLRDAGQRKFDVVLRWKLDRFGRWFIVSPVCGNWNCRAFALSRQQRALTPMKRTPSRGSWCTSSRRLPNSSGS